MFRKCIWGNSTDKYIWKNQSLKVWYKQKKSLKRLSKLGTNHSLNSRHVLDIPSSAHLDDTDLNLQPEPLYSIRVIRSMTLCSSCPFGGKILLSFSPFLFKFNMFIFFVSKSFVEVAEVTLQLWIFVTQGRGNEWWDCLHLNHQH